MNRFPAEEGWRMPAEWEAHDATWLAWPHEVEDWPGKFAPIPWVYTEIIRHLHRYERVHLLVEDNALAEDARRHLAMASVDLEKVRFFPFATDRVWTRDYGPTFLINARSELALLDWQFNAWAKYPNWHKDNAVPRQIADALALRSWQPDVDGQRLVLEGGSIDVDGAGLLLTTEECLVGDVQARNPGRTRADLESAFERYLGVKKVLWLNRGIVGDDTHGHIDDVARFVAPGTVVAAMEYDRSDANYELLQENRERLRAMSDLEGEPLEIVELPMPAPVFFQSQRLPASYANFYIANELVLVPTFNDANDRHALNVLAELFPGRRVVGIHAVDLVWGLGTLHCMTQQQPSRLRWA